MQQMDSVWYYCMSMKFYKYVRYLLVRYFGVGNIADYFGRIVAVLKSNVLFQYCLGYWSGELIFCTIKG